MNKEQLIEGYFEGTLNETQQLELEALIVQDPAVAAELNFRKQVQQAIRSEERSLLKKKLQSFEQQKKRIPSTTVYRSWLTAAAVLLITATVSLWWYTGRFSADRLYDSYFESFPNIVQPLVRGESQTSNLSQAFVSYEQGAYRKAATLFSETSDLPAQFYGALCEMELGEHQKAKDMFDKIPLTDTTLRPFIQWYKALNLVKLNQVNQADEVLLALEKENDFELKEQLSRLRKELNSRFFSEKNKEDGHRNKH